MKTIKYTTVALALIAAASFTSSANAANQGDLILGIYDSNTGGNGYVATDYVVDLGAYSSLSANESFNLGSAINTLFGADTTATLVFNIDGIGNASSSALAGGLAKKQWAFTATTQPNIAINNTSESGNINTMYAGLGQTQSTALTGGTSSNGTAFSAFSQPVTFTSSFFMTSSQAGGGFGDGVDITTPYSTTASAAFYTLTSGGQSITSDPTGITGGDLFKFGGTANAVTLTFDPAAAPEPSAYALGLCAAALFWVLNRRRSVA